MAVNKPGDGGNNGNNAGNDQVSPGGPIPQSPQQPQQPPPRRAGGVGNLNRMLSRAGRRDLSDARAQEALGALQEARKDSISNQQLEEDKHFELLLFSREQHKVGLPSILITQQHRIGGELYLIVRTLLLDSKDITLPTRTFNPGGMERIEVTTYPQDVFNDAYWGRIEAFVRERAGAQANVPVINAGPRLIPTDFDFSEERAVKDVLIDNVNRVGDTAARLYGEEPFSIVESKGPNEVLSTTIEFTDGQHHDLVGMPIRSDISVKMMLKDASNQRQDLGVQEFYESDTVLNGACGFVNLEYAPQQQQMSGFGQPQQPQPPFLPAFVITDVRNSPHIEANTLELYLLAISNAYRVTAGRSWARQFIPRGFGKGPDFRDIGALGYMTEQGKMIDTRSGNFSEEDLANLLSVTVRPDLAFMMDIDPVGDQSSLSDYFLMAATKNPNQQRAHNALVAAADNLTGGVFSKVFPSGAPLAIPTDQEIHMGYYMDSNAERRDIRDLDALAVLNACQGDLNMYYEWYRTFVDGSMPPPKRLQLRENIERSLLTKNMVITGRAIRLILSPELIKALDEGCSAAGIQVQYNHMDMNVYGRQFVGNQALRNYMVQGQASFTGMPGAQNYSGFSGSYGAPAGRRY